MNKYRTIFCLGLITLIGCKAECQKYKITERTPEEIEYIRYFDSIVDERGSEGMERIYKRHCKAVTRSSHELKMYKLRNK